MSRDSQGGLKAKVAKVPVEAEEEEDSKATRQGAQALNNSK
jgi:hypothetical protein